VPRLFGHGPALGRWSGEVRVMAGSPSRLTGRSRHEYVQSRIRGREQAAGVGRVAGPAMATDTVTTSGKPTLVAHTGPGQSQADGMSVAPRISKVPRSYRLQEHRGHRPVAGRRPLQRPSGHRLPGPPGRTALAEPRRPKLLRPEKSS
jgi:hypothetical protein